jgi:hypothetical protein
MVLPAPAAPAAIPLPQARRVEHPPIPSVLPAPRAPRPADAAVPPPAPASPGQASAPGTADAAGPPKVPAKRRPLAGLSWKWLILISSAVLGLILLVVGWLVWRSFQLEPFTDPPRKYRPGTMVELRKLTTLKAPGPGEQVAYAHKHQRLFLRNPQKGIWVLDAADGRVLELYPPRREFVHMALSPSEDFLFVADRGKVQDGWATETHYVHRYDLAKKTWEVQSPPTRQVPQHKQERINDKYVRQTRTGSKTVPGSVGRLFAVSDSRFLIPPGPGEGLRLALYRWGDGAELVEQTSREEKYHQQGEFAYDPRTGLFYFIANAPNEAPIGANRVAGSWLLSAHPYSSVQDLKGMFAKGGGPGPMVLSTNGKFLYLGKYQVAPGDVSKVLREFPEMIRAASDDLAFGDQYGWFNAHTGEKLGAFQHNAAHLCLSMDNSRLWVHGASESELHCYAIEGKE